MGELSGLSFAASGGVDDGPERYITPGASYLALALPPVFCFALLGSFALAFGPDTVD